MTDMRVWKLWRAQHILGYVAVFKEEHSNIVH